MAAQWQLNGCCGNEETVFLCFYAGYVVLFGLIYKTTLMKPMRLLAVFLHEFSHAFLCWITGGKVEAIEVNDNEGTDVFDCCFWHCKLLFVRVVDSTVTINYITIYILYIYIYMYDRWCDQVPWWLPHINHPSRLCWLCFLGWIIRFHVRKSDWGYHRGGRDIECAADFTMVRVRVACVILCQHYAKILLLNFPDL